MRRLSGCLQESNHGGLFRVEVTTNQRYRKIPKISPGAYIFQRPFLGGLLLVGLIFGGAYLRRGICVLKSIGLAYSCKEIYRFCFVLLCIWGPFPSTSSPGGFYSEGRRNGGFFALRVWGGGGLIQGGAYFRNLTVFSKYMGKPGWKMKWLAPFRFESVYGKRQKLWAVICGDAIFQLFLVCSAVLDIRCSRSFFHLVKFYTFIFMHKISTRVVCVNVEHPRFYPVLQLWGFCGLKHYTPFYAQDFLPGGLCKWWAPPVLPRTSVMRLLRLWSIIPLFMHKISSRVVCVNGEPPRFYPVLQLWGFCGFEALYPFLCTRFPPGWFV